MLDSISQSLNLDWTALLLNAGVFVVLLIIMDRIFWKPIMAHIAKRNQRIADAYQAVDAARQEMEQLRGEYQLRIATVDAEARTKIQQTLKTAQATREALLAEARATTEQLKAEAQVQLEKDRADARASTEAGLANAATEALARAQGVAADQPQVNLIQQYIRSGAERN